MAQNADEWETGAEPADEWETGAEPAAADAGEPIVAQQMAQPSLKEKLLSGALSFASGFPGVPSMVAAGRGIYKAAGAEAPAEAYRKERAQTLGQIEQATRESSPEIAGVPVLPVAGAVAGGLVGAPATMGARLAAGAYAGALQGVGSGGADISRGQFAESAKEAATGGAYGAAGATLGEILGAAGRASKRIADRNAIKIAEKAAEAAKATTQSAFGEAGRAGQAVKKGTDYIRTVLDNPGDYLPEQVLEAEWLSKQPDFIEAQQRVAKNAMEAFLPNVSRQKETAQKFAELAANEQARAEAATASALKNPLYEAVAPRLGRFAQRAALGAAGEAIAGTTGGIVASVPGTVQMSRNLLKDPRFGYALGKYGAAGFGAASAIVGRGGVAENVRQNTENAFGALQSRFGIQATDKDQLSDEWFLKGQTDEQAQPGKER